MSEHSEMDEQTQLAQQQQMSAMQAAWREMKAQLVELQTQLAFQEDALQALDNVVTDQQQRIDQLTVVNSRLEQQLGELESWADEQRVETPPPHY
jgi:SlyX protein